MNQQLIVAILGIIVVVGLVGLLVTVRSAPKPSPRLAADARPGPFDGIRGVIDRSIGMYLIRRLAGRIVKPPPEPLPPSAALSVDEVAYRIGTPGAVPPVTRAIGADGAADRAGLTVAGVAAATSAATSVAAGPTTRVPVRVRSPARRAQPVGVPGSGSCATRASPSLDWPRSLLVAAAVLPGGGPGPSASILSVTRPTRRRPRSPRRRRHLGRRRLARWCRRPFRPRPRPPFRPRRRHRHRRRRRLRPPGRGSRHAPPWRRPPHRRRPQRRLRPPSQRQNRPRSRRPSRRRRRPRRRR